MSLTLLSNSYQNEFSGNSIYARFNTNNYINTTGVKSSWIIGISSTPNFGSQFGFTSNLLSITFAFLNSYPSISGNNHKLTVPSGTWSNAKAQAVCVEINTYADFALYYIATAIGTNIKIEAKATGADYSMYSRGVSGVTNGTYIAGVSEVLEQNYKIVLFLKNQSDDSVIGKLSFNQIDGYAEVDLKDLLHAQRKWDFAHVSSFMSFGFDDFGLIYYLYYTDSFGLPPTQRALTQGPATVAIPAKVDTSYLNRQINPAPTYSNFYGLGGFLESIVTNAPRVNKRIDLEKNDYLLWAVSGDVLLVKYTAHYANNTTANIFEYFEDVANSFYRVTVNFGKLSSLSNQDDIIGFDVVFLDSIGDTRSGVINYQVDRDNYPDKRNFVFQNKWWGIDTLLCTGVVSDNAAFDKDIIASSGQYPMDKKFYTRINKISETKTFVQNTGWLNKDEILVFEDMLRSEHVYVYDNKLQDYKKIVISTDKVQLKESLKGMNAYEFEYSENSSI
jgi:hypothetical protein